MITTADYAHVGQQTYSATVWGSNEADRWVIWCGTFATLPEAKRQAARMARPHANAVGYLVDAVTAVDNWVDSSFTDGGELVRDASSETDPDSPQWFGSVDERGRVTWTKG